MPAEPTFDWRLTLAVGLALGVVFGVVGTRLWIGPAPVAPPDAVPAADPPPRVTAPPAGPKPSGAPAPEWPAPTPTGAPLHALRTASELRARFATAIAASKVVGEVVRVDCSELPCVTYGAVDQANTPDQVLDRPPLDAADAGKRILFRWASEPDGPYVWRMFAVAWLPPEMDPEAQTAARESVTRRYRAARIERLKVGSRPEKE